MLNEIPFKLHNFRTDNLLSQTGVAMRFYKFVVRVLDYCRVSAIVILVGGLILLLVPQGTEITVRLEHSGWGQAFFIAAVAFWAWESWFWSRIMLRDRMPRDASRRSIETFVIDYFPRILGALGFVLALVSMWRNGVDGPGFWILAATFVVSFAYWVSRGKISESEFPLLFWRKEPRVKLPNLKPDKFTRFSKGWIWFSGFAIAGLFIWAVVSPVNMGYALGSGPVVFAALGSIAVVGNSLVFLTRKKGFPLVIVLLLIAGFWSGTDLFDNHNVRTLQGAKRADATSLPEAFSNWLNQKEKSDSDKPLVVVATSGGGLRAAYWTATVLGALQDAIPEFSNRLFAISGVSGGSLGAVVFNEVLASSKKEIDCSEPEIRNKSVNGTCYEAYGQEALSADFLAPSVTAMMYGDLVQRFLPIGFSDRAQALEEGWETRWERVTHNRRMAEGFRTLWSKNKDSWLPVLLLNGTHEETGRRMITSDVAIDSNIFTDAFDFYLTGGQDVRPFVDGEISAATAAHNSARFSYISPAGTLNTGGHIIDGGYFENYGAQSLKELLDAIKNRLPPGLSVLIIQISNDPMPNDNLADVSPGGGGVADTWFNETLAPIRGLLKTREARGVSAAKILRNWSAETKTGSREVRHVHFRLYKPKKRNSNPKLALGWVLSSDSECSMKVQLRKLPDNRKAFAEVIKAFNKETLRDDAAVAKALATALPENDAFLAKLCGPPGEQEDWKDKFADWNFSGR